MGISITSVLSFPSNDFVMSDLINDDVLSALKVYYGMVGDYDSLDRWIFFFVKN